MTFTLITLQDTWFKTQPVDSNNLSDNQKMRIPSGSQFAPLSWAYADNNHISFNVSATSVLYAFISDISLAKNENADLGI